MLTREFECEGEFVYRENYPRKTELQKGFTYLKVTLGNSINFYLVTNANTDYRIIGLDREYGEKLANFIRLDKYQFPNIEGSCKTAKDRVYWCRSDNNFFYFCRVDLTPTLPSWMFKIWLEYRENFLREIYDLYYESFCLAIKRPYTRVDL